VAQRNDRPAGNGRQNSAYRSGCLHLFYFPVSLNAAELVQGGDSTEV
jgi:hypothetical protein